MLKLTTFLLLSASATFAQLPPLQPGEIRPGKGIFAPIEPEFFGRELLRRDSSISIVVMPILRTQNDFYRNPADAPDVLRASIDNMPVKAGYSGPDMPNSLQPRQPLRPRVLPSLPDSSGRK